MAIAVSIIETVQVISCLFCQAKIARITVLFELVSSGLSSLSCGWKGSLGREGRTACDDDEDTQEEDGHNTELLFERHADSEDLGDWETDDWRGC